MVSAEVFRKEDLEINKSMDEKRGKQKRRDRVLKSKSSSKTKVWFAVLQCLLYLTELFIQTALKEQWRCVGSDKGQGKHCKHLRC